MSSSRLNTPTLLLATSLVIGTITYYSQPSRVQAVVLPETDISTACEEDINADGLINLLDYSLLVGSFLKKPFKVPKADINKDGEVNIFDYSRLVKKFNQRCLAVESPPTGVLTPDKTVLPQSSVAPVSSPTPKISPLPVSSPTPKISPLPVSSPTPTSGVSGKNGLRPEDNAGSTTKITPDVESGSSEAF